MLLKVKHADITTMTSDMMSFVNLDYFAKIRRMRMAIRSQSARLIQLTTVKVLMEPGEDTHLNTTDTGSSTMTALVATGSVKTA